MNKLITAFSVLFFISVLLSGIMEGGGGLAVTSLSADVTDAGLVLNVADTEGFNSPDYVWIGDEKILYTARYYLCD